MSDPAEIALSAPLDVLVSIGASLADHSIDPDHLGTSADPEGTAAGLIENLNAVVSASAMPGTLKGVLPRDLYVFALGTDPRQPIRFGRLGWGSKCYVVTEHLKRILERLPGDRSEFYPVSVVYRNIAGTADLGGGEVIRGVHWIWYCYAVHDLIDVPASRATFQLTSQHRFDVAGHPEIAFNIVGTNPADGLPSLILHRTPYKEAAAFHVLGLWSRTPFALPDFVRLLHDAGSSTPDLTMQLAPRILDEQRWHLARQAIRAGKLARDPPLRIVGTNWIIRDRYDPPFYSRRPLFAPTA